MEAQTELFAVSTPVQQVRRSSMEIMCEILEVVSMGVERPTHIIYKANISWKVLNSFLKTLIKNNLLVKENDGKRAVYKMTDKGYSVLALYRDLKERLLVEKATSSQNSLPAF